MLDNHEKLECVICQEELLVSDDIRTLDCGHSFHKKCIDAWRRVNNNCPTCRDNLSEISSLTNTNIPRTNKWFIGLCLYLGINIILFTTTILLLFSRPINLYNETNY